MPSHTIVYNRIIDLTHVLSPTMPVWPGDPPPSIQPVARLKPDGYALNRLSVGEHSGTHLGAPAHFHPEGATVDWLPVEALVRPAVVLDVRPAAGANPDYALGRADVLSWEGENGRVPEGSLVLLLTGWQDRWHDPRAYLNPDSAGVLHFPGFALEAAGFLLDERGVAGLGTDTHGVDPGADGHFQVNRWLLGKGGIHLENLANLDRLPPAGAVLVIGALPIEHGTGSPARVLAFVP